MIKKDIGIPKLVEEDKDFPFIVVSPRCPADHYWIPSVLKKLLNDVCSKLRVDRNRIYLTGLSMGGYGTWYTAIEYPKLFAQLLQFVVEVTHIEYADLATCLFGHSMEQKILLSHPRNQ